MYYGSSALFQNQDCSNLTINLLRLDVPCILRNYERTSFAAVVGFVESSVTLKLIITQEGWSGSPFCEKFHQTAIKDNYNKIYCNKNGSAVLKLCTAKISNNQPNKTSLFFRFLIQSGSESFGGASFSNTGFPP